MAPTPCPRRLPLPPPQKKGRRLYVAPAVKDHHEVTVTFQLPSLRSEYASKPEHYISHLVGHEGPGSLLSALKVRASACAAAECQPDDTTRAAHAGTHRTKLALAACVPDCTCCVYPRLVAGRMSCVLAWMMTASAPTQQRTCSRCPSCSQRQACMQHPGLAWHPLRCCLRT
jgi:hypothetical protein